MKLIRAKKTYVGYKSESNCYHVTKIKINSITLLTYKHLLLLI